MYTTVQDQKGNLEVLVHLDVDCRDRKAIRASEATDHQDHLAEMEEMETMVSGAEMVEMETMVRHTLSAFDNTSSIDITCV